MKSDTSDLSFPFSIVPFQAKGKEENEDDGLKLMTDPQDPSFFLWISKAAFNFVEYRLHSAYSKQVWLALVGTIFRHNCPSKLGKFCSRFAFAFTANSLNRIMRIWVCLKRHHRRNRAKTILFFYGYNTNGRSSERRTSSLLECYPESCRTNPKGNAQL